MTVKQHNVLVQELTRYFPYMGYPHYRQVGLAIFYYDLALELMLVGDQTPPAGRRRHSRRGGAAAGLGGLTIEFAVDELLKNK